MNKIRKVGQVTIFDDTTVIKAEPDLTTLENYLKSRDFLNFLAPESREDNKNKYLYIEDYSISINQKGLDLAKCLGLLHSKTSYQRETKKDTYQAIHDSILGYVNYLDEQYLQILKDVEYQDFPSPSNLIFMCNYSKIKEVLNFCRHETDNWFNLVNNNKRERVCLNHGNIDCTHIICASQPYLISWAHNHVDSPVVDLINLYRKEWNHLEFSSILDTYLKYCELNDAEKKLLFINISIPLIPEHQLSEFNNTIELRHLFDYIYKTEELIGPYYTTQNKEQK